VRARFLIVSKSRRGEGEGRKGEDSGDRLIERGSTVVDKRWKRRSADRRKLEERSARGAEVGRRETDGGLAEYNLKEGRKEGMKE
jgi:hypothetical protein